MADERTAEEVAEIFTAAADSVTLINADANFTAYGTRTDDTSTTETEWKAKMQRNVEHLETIKAYTKTDGSTSIWTSEDFTDIDAAIIAGKKLYS